MKQVIYDTLGFLEKNRDLLHSDLLHLLSSCEASMPRVFATMIEQASVQKTMRSHRRKPAESQKQTVATKFKVCISLSSLNNSGNVHEVCSYY